MDPQAKAGVPSQSRGWREDQKDAVRVFVDHAWEVMKWHRERAEAWDRLAGQVLAFSGVLILLLNSLAGRVDDVRNPHHRRFLEYGLALTLTFLLLAGLTALSSLMGRLRSVRSPTEEIQNEWRQFRHDRQASAADLLTQVATALIGEPETKSAAIVDLRNSAMRREARTRIAATVLSLGIGCAAAILAGTVLWT